MYASVNITEDIVSLSSSSIKSFNGLTIADLNLQNNRCSTADFIRYALYEKF